MYLRKVVMGLGMATLTKCNHIFDGVGTTCRCWYYMMHLGGLERTIFGANFGLASLTHTSVPLQNSASL
jgi:hypothetical protein